MGRRYLPPSKPFCKMVDPDHIVFDGWDISGMNLADAMERSKVFEWDLQRQLAPHLRKISPRPGIFDPSFIAANQGSRADNFIKGTKKQQMHRIRADIRDFKEKSQVDKVVVLWTANTERYSEIIVGLNDCEGNLGEHQLTQTTQKWLRPPYTPWRVLMKVCLSLMARLRIHLFPV